ncbi:MAG: 2-C-methyl-D-erythritol 4-phosphate cytidylyltransferase [Acutalibacteraceae bacterium]|nr:2-C-methyl-D-erythritol 4-phosphate cytidylyltransferase [Acutalibacteraceae bacterium]
MPKLDFALQFEKNTEALGGIPVVIVAAGSASRMQGIDKMFAPLCGIPILAVTLRAFENCPFVSEITVVTRKEKISDVLKLGRSYAVSKLKNVVEGGDCREASVKNGVMLYNGKCDKILIHDGARPLVTSAVIERTAKGLNDYDSVTCAVKLKDTVKKIDPQGKVIETPDRTSLVSVQTPQGVKVSEFLRILEEYDPSNFTDDTSVMEAGGYATYTVEGDYTNIKVTTPEDIVVAEVFLGKEW